MAEQLAFSEAPQQPRFADAFVIFAVTVLSVAIGAWLLLRLKVPLWSGTVAALCVYMLLLSLHLLVRRAFVPERPAPDSGSWVSHAMARAESHQLPLNAEDALRRMTEAAAGMAPTSAQLSHRHAEAPAAAHRREPARDPARGGRARAGPVPATGQALGPASGHASGPQLGQGLGHGIGQGLGHASPPGGAGTGGVAPALGPAAGAAAGPTAPSAVRDPFHFRPSREPAPPPLVRPQPAAQKHAPPPPPAAADPNGMSVEVIQDLIKKLADELNAPPGEGVPQTGDHRPGEPEARPNAPPRDATPAPRPGTGAGQPPAGASPPSPPSAPLARLAEAVTAQRVEILLEPIHALVEGRPRHVEVSMRLVTADGAAVEQAELVRAARGTPLMPRIDTLRVMHAMRVARRLGDRGRQGSVLALIDGQSLVDEAFLAAAVSEAGTAVAKRLVLSFAQAAVRAFSGGHTEVLKTLVRAGLRFALDEVADLDMDFAALKAMGFDFLKLDAQRFLEGLPVAGGRMPASDICRHLADYGLTLIVGRIEDEWLLARILGFGVQFGKGALFGAPRIVRDEAGAADAAAGVRS